MSVVTVRSAALVGVDAYGVDVEVAVINSLPGLKTVGLPDAALKEGSERILLALRHQGLLTTRPSVIVNLAPAELHKFGSRYELAIALGILVLRGQVPEATVKELLVVGELSLHGDVRPVRGALAMAAMARDQGFAAIVVPRDNAPEATLVGGLTVYGVATLRELVEGLRGERPLEPYVHTPVEFRPERHAPDFADVRGQAEARRAAEIAAAGGHNLLLIGPPGSGKTMIARRIAGILPPLETVEAIETTRVLSAAGVLPARAGLLRTPPFRAPHHTVSSAGLVGGYAPPRPGEVSLAHNGLLFLDEMAEFSRASLESLREPMEEGKIRIIRGGVSCTFPARFILVAATNPCPCGYLGDGVRRCSCPQGSVLRYRARLSGPLLDRIDMHVEVPRLAVATLAGVETGESSTKVAARVVSARRCQEERRADTGVATNAQLPERAVRELVPLGDEERRALMSAVERLGLSPRAYVRVLKVARTIADLDTPEGKKPVSVRLPHILEAVQYRALDRSVL